MELISGKSLFASESFLVASVWNLGKSGETRREYKNSLSFFLTVSQSVSFRLINGAGMAGQAKAKPFPGRENENKKKASLEHWPHMNFCSNFIYHHYHPHPYTTLHSNSIYYLVIAGVFGTCTYVSSTEMKCNEEESIM